MRIENSIRNSTIASLAIFIQILLGFISQKLFIVFLNVEYMGINSLFTNIISFLSVAELGIGEAIIYHLYEPIVNNEINKIKALLNSYRKAYNLIAVIVLGIGILLIPFIDFFVKTKISTINLKIVYLLFLLQSVLSYVLSYKKSILYANQKNYIVSLIHILYLLGLNFTQLLILYLTKNYYLYLVIKIIFVLIENIVISVIVNKVYVYIKDLKDYQIDKNLEKDLLNMVKAKFIHKIGQTVVISSDNIIISKFISITTVGLYSNYFLIISSIKNLFAQLIMALTPSIGNLLLENNCQKSFDIYKKIRFFNFWIASFSQTSILVIIQSFISIWMGKGYLLSISIVFVSIINFYQKLMRSCNDVFLDGAGICIENKYVPVAESILNIVFSILLLKIFGLSGVFMGTIISGLALWCYSYPKFVYKGIFKRNYFDYAKETIGYFLLFIIIATFTYVLSSIVVVNNLFIKFIINCLLALTIPNSILFLIFHKTDNFKYFLNIFLVILNKVKESIKKI